MVTMKYIQEIVIYLTFFLAIKMLFFDDVIDLGIIDEHYGITFFILLIILKTCYILNKKRKQ